MLAASLLCVPIARAQTADASPIDGTRTDSRLHVGPFYVAPQMVLRQFGVDNNVFNQATDAKSDFTVDAAPELDVALPVSHRALVRVTGIADLVYFAKYSSERSVNPLIKTRGETYFQRLTLYGEASVDSSRERPNFEIDVRSRRLESDIHAGAQLHVTPKFSVDLAGRRETTGYDAGTFAEGVDLRTTLNHSSTGVLVTPRYDVTPYTTASAQLEVFHDEFPFDAARGSSNLRMMPGIEFNPRALISGQAYVGYRRLTPDNPSLMPAFAGVVANVGLSYRLLSATKVDVTFNRDLQYSLELLQPYFIDNSVGASIRRQLGGSFDVAVHGERHLYRYENYLPAVPGAAELANRTDQTVLYWGSLGYWFRRDLRLGFTVTSSNRESPLPGRSYTGVRFGTDLTHGF